MRLALLILGLACFHGCAMPRGPVCANDMAAMKSELLYFGTESPEGPVSAQQWAVFLETIVTPRFPDGLSVWPASGQWSSGTGEIGREESYVLNIVHAGSAAEEQAFQEIIEAYKMRFHQEAVLRTQSNVCANL